jgi:hypothetical protein
MRLDDAVTFGVERHGADGRPVAALAGPARRILLTSAGTKRMPARQDRVIVAGMALSRAHVANAAVAMLMVVPMHEAGRPGARLVQVGEEPMAGTSISVR